MDERTKEALERYTGDKYDFEKSPMDAHFEMVADMADVANWAAKQYSPEPLTPKRTVEMGGEANPTSKRGKIYWWIGNNRLTISYSKILEGWIVKIEDTVIPRPIRTVGDLRRLLDCLGWESGQEGGE